VSTTESNRYQISQGECVYTIETDRKTYPVGTPVNITVSLVNMGQNPVTLVSASGHQYEIVIISARIRVYAHQGGLWATGAHILNRGQVLTFQHTWTQQGRQGNQVPRGIYDVVGYVPAMMPPPLTVQITVI
jgi:Intracellular proteinase inhibitor